jgi:hypothetical protein
MMIHMRQTLRCLAIGVMLLAVPKPALAGWDLLLFLGRSFPKSDERLTFPLPAPSFPGIDVTVAGTPRLETDGGLTFGGAVTAEAGLIGIEGRLDSPSIGFDVIGARYILQGVQPPLNGLAATILLSDGRLDVNRLNLWSANLRVRTPGPVALVASGGLTFLPTFKVSGSVPLVVEGPVSGLSTRLRLAVAPGESKNRTGVNAGAGLRIGSSHVALVAEGRVFYFREYELQIRADSELPVLGGTVASFPPVRFRPLIVTTQVGLLFGF